MPPSINSYPRTEKALKYLVFLQRAYSAKGRTPEHRPREAHGARGGQRVIGEESSAAGAREPGV
jgi:hypothetical protein